MRPPLRLLHISDLHAFAREDFNQRVLINGLLEDLAGLVDEQPMDGCILTGDLAFSGVPADYELVRELLLDPLMARLSLDPGKVILVPGNHDVNRARIIDYMEKGLVAQLQGPAEVNELLRDERSLSLALERMNDWQDFHQSFYRGVEHPPVRVGPLAWLHTLETAGPRAAIVAMNSAWRSSGANDRGQLLLGDEQIHEAVTALGDTPVRIVAMHHPLDWLAKFDEDQAHLSFESNGLIVLSGHEHVLNPTGEASIRGAAIYSRTGCLYDGRGYRNAYAVLEINLETDRLTALLRTWFPLREVFDAAVDVAPEGRLELPLPHKPGGIRVHLPPYTTVLAGLAGVAQKGSVIADYWSDSTPPFRDLVVEPRFYPLPFERAAAAARRDPEKGRLQRADPLEGVRKHRVVIVSGDRESGVTNSLLWIVATSFESDAGRLPVYAPLARLPGRDPLDRVLREACSRSGLALQPKDTLPPLVAAIDDVAPNDPRLLARVARHMKAHEESLYVLGCHGEDHVEVARALEEQGLSVDRVFIGPFGRRELRELVLKISGEEIPALTERVLVVVFGESLPRTPFIMAALIAVLQAQADMTAINESTILDAYASLLLGRSDVGDVEGLGMDFRRREYLLASFAGHLAERKVDRLSRFDTEQYVLKYFEDLGWERSLSAGRVIDSLIRRRILDQTEEGVGFRHPALQFLFTGKWMLENSAFAAYVLGDWLWFARAIDHAAALKRSDRELLAAVGTRAAAVVRTAEDGISLVTFDQIAGPKGWSSEVDIERLRHQLAAVARNMKPTEEELDQLYEDMEVDLAARDDDGDVEIRQGLSELISAVLLLGSVLASSELVDDVALKTEELKRVVHGWSLVACITAVQEDMTSAYHDLYGSVIDSLPDDKRRAELREAIDYFVGLTMTGAMAGVLSGMVATPQLAAAIRALVADEEFMSSAAHALFGTVLFCGLRLSGWPDQLAALFERYRGHPFVAEIAKDYALYEYMSLPGPAKDVGRLEAFLADVHVGSQKSVDMRARARSLALTELKQARINYRQSQGTESLLDVLDNGNSDGTGQIGADGTASGL